MKKTIVALILILLIAVLPSAVAVGAVDVSPRDVTPTVYMDDLTVTAGNSFTVTLKAKGLESTASLSLSLFYDADLFECTADPVAGSMLSGGTTSTNRSVPGEINMEFISVSPIEGDGTLFTLRFRALSSAPAGVYPFALAVGEAYSPDLAPLTISAQSGNVTVKNAATVTDTVTFYASRNKSSVKAGESVTFTLYTHSPKQLAAVDFEIEYDPDKLVLDTASLGSAMTNASGAVYSINTDSEGYVKITYATPGGLSGSLNPAVALTFTAKEGGSGVATVSFKSSNLYNASLVHMEGTSPSTSVTLTENAPEIDLPDISIGGYEGLDDSFTLDVTVPGALGLAAADFTVSFDPEMLQCVSIEKTKSEYLFVSNIKNEEGKVTFSFICEQGETEDSVIARLTFSTEGLKGGNPNLQLSGRQLTDASFVSVEADIVSSPVILHKHGDPATCTTDEVCSVEGCDKVLAEKYGHALVHVDEKEPTCTASGYYSYDYCTRCDYTTIEMRPQLPHKAGKEATCTTDQTCVTCGAILVERLGHRVLVGGIILVDSITYENDSNFPFELTEGCFVSTNHTDSTDSYFKVTALYDCSLEITYGVSSETNYDKLNIKKNGSSVDSISGSVEKNVTIELLAGDVVTINYHKDVSVSNGGDIGYFSLACEQTEIDTSVPAPAEDAEPTCTEAVICHYCQEVVKKALGHDEVTHDAKAPTCTEIGWEAYVTCSRCDHTTYAEIPATGHTTSDWIVDVDATCVSDGSKHKECTVCKVILSTETIPMLGHGEIAHEAKAPTCTEIGWHEYVTCTRCDYTTYVEIPATGHTTSDWIVDADATCTVDGSKHKECTVCKTVLAIDIIPMLGHDEIAHEPKTPTCTEIGWKAYATCSRCEYTTYAEIPATGHSASDWIVDADATCVSDGSKYKECTVCKVILSTETIPMLGHDEVSHSAKAPTCTEIGWNEYVTCLRCDHTTYVEIPTTGHTTSDWIVDADATCTVDGSKHKECTVCKTVLAIDIIPMLGHDEITHGAKAPTCTEIGWKAYATCSRCEYTTYAEIPATGHSASDWIVDADATCVSNGSKHKECTVCKVILSTEMIPMLGHDEVSHSAKAPTCTEIGWEAYVTCSRCDHTTYAEIPATGHTTSDWIVDVDATCVSDGSKHKECTVCKIVLSTDRIPMLGHGEITHEAKAPTCTEIGWKAYVTCSRCDYTTYVVIPATGHTAGDWIVDADATCTVDGSKHKECTVCKTVLATDIIPMLGHDGVSHSAKAPTCTEIGWKAYVTCLRCDYTTYVEVPATGHTASDWIVDVDATCVSDGSKHKECTVCKVILSTETIPMLGHDEITHGAKAPTCTEIGWHEYVTCTRCDYTTYVEIPSTGHSLGEWKEVLEPDCLNKGTDRRNCAYCDHYETRDVDPLGHDEITHDAKAPTCTEFGWKAYVTCTRCDHTTYEKISATGHVASEWIVDKEATYEEDGTKHKECTVCHEVIETSKIPMLTHSYVSVVTAPTCVAQGYTTHTCSDCGDSYVDDYVPAKGHKYGDWHCILAPACETVGTDRRDCNACDHYETREISATGHSASDWIVDADATCVSDGSKYKECTVCKVILSTETIPMLGHDEVSHSAKAPTCTEIGWNEYVTCLRCDHTTYVEIPATGHTTGDWIVDADATCTVDGSKHKECTVCRAVVSTETIPMLGHDEITHGAKAPTCTEIGWKAYVTCLRCDHTTYVEIPATGHTTSDWIVDVDATCVSNGSKHKECTVCKVILSTEMIPMLGHDEVSHSAKAPTCTEIGWNEYVTCLRCDHTTYVEIPATGHTTSDWIVDVDATCVSDGSKHKECAVCKIVLSTDRIPMLGHDEIAHEAKAPTCTEIGWKDYVTCSRCDYTTYVVIPATGHTAGDWIVDADATCTVDGSKHKECSACKAVVSVEVIPMLGHGEVSHSEKAPTCTEIGWNAYVTCSRCDYTTYVVIPATGHTAGDWIVDADATCTVDGLKHKECTVCKVILSTETIPMLGHGEITHEAKAPTCTEIGWKDYVTCSRCDYTTYVVIPATGHTAGDWIVDADATCTVDGSKHKECSACKAVVSVEAIPMLGHDEVSHSAKAPTCTEIGWNAYVTCSRCDYTTYVVIPATGHNAGDWIVDADATCTEDGSRYKECSVCKAVVSVEAIPMLGHDEVSHSAKAPTCTEIGWNAYVTCSRCDYKTYVELSAKGHSLGEWKDVLAPDCLNKGVERRACENCDYLESRDTDALGHDYSDEWTIDINPTCTAVGSKSHHCSRCDERMDVTEISASGHSYGEWREIEAPTCTEAGTGERKCSVCNYVETKATSALGHIKTPAVIENRTDPDCVKDGCYDEVVYCEVCDEELSRTTVKLDKLGHEYSFEWTTDAEPTCTSEGSKSHHCIRCDEKSDVTVISAVGHTYDGDSDASCNICGEARDIDTDGTVESETAETEQTVESTETVEQTETDAVGSETAETEQTVESTETVEPTETDAIESNGENENKSGCESSVSGSCVAFIAMMSVGALWLAKKKKQD